MLTTTQSSVGSAERPDMTNVAWHRHQGRGKDYTFSLLVIRKHQSLELLHSGGKRDGKEPLDTTRCDVWRRDRFFVILGSRSTAGGRRDNFRYAVT